MNDLRTAAQQVLEAWDDLPSYQKPTVLYPQMDALRAALAQQAEPAPLKRGITGRCTRKVCECEKEGLGPECIHLEPVVDGYPLWSGLPKAEPVEPVAWMLTDAYNPRVRFLEWEKETRAYSGDWIKTPLYTAPPQRKPQPTTGMAEIERLRAERDALAQRLSEVRALLTDTTDAHRKRVVMNAWAADRLARHGIPMPEGDPK